MTVSWHGKLPSTGDFASRRLDSAHVALLDAWLATLMETIRRQSGDDWLAAYLASPSWRFVWMPNASPTPCRGRAWVGVLMPSVDRAGRYYPLLLLHALDRVPCQAHEREALWSWLQQLDQIAASALHDDWTIESLEAALETLGEPPSSEEAPPAALADESNSLRRLELSGSIPEWGFAREVAAPWLQAASDRCYWYGVPDAKAAIMLISNGLDDEVLAGVLLGGF